MPSNYLVQGDWDDVINKLEDVQGNRKENIDYWDEEQDNWNPEKLDLEDVNKKSYNMYDSDSDDYINSLEFYLTQAFENKKKLKLISYLFLS